MTVVTSPDFVSFSDMELLRALTSCERRPNLLVDCVDGGAGAVLTQLRELCVGPFYSCELPGALELPQQGGGTLLLHDVAALTIAQQVALFDWLHQQKGPIQVVSLTQKRLLSLVCDGRFLEGLFYRLNTISITARGAR
ncbi:MAG TPA: sigma 54-interacting transcriptional regulator [Vicinamibacterales bacterium]|jgi:transcriptional regulator of aromatic amino acid metabolism